MILLDNCEHLLDSSAHLASALLKECPSVWLVATSREAVGVEGEVSYRVPSLSFPSADLNLDLLEDLPAFESVKLFIDRAEQVRPHFSATAENAAAIATICRRLDGIPLAIEWAAARIRMLSPAQIADALSERFDLLIGGARTALPRQRTLEASLDWSFNLLSVEERAVLARLSVFSGTFDLNAAEEITQGGGIDRYRILELLSGLADKSLVQVEESGVEARYRLLETVRAYARQKLVDSGELADVRNGHLDYYVTLAEGAEPELRGPWFSEWSKRLTEEIDNLRTALEWAISSHQEEKHLRLTGALLVFWVNRSMYAEIQQSMEVALSGATDRAVRAKALSSAARMSVMAARYRCAVELARECVELAREINDERSLGWALLSLGWAEFWMGERGLDHMEEAVRLGKELADSHLEISASIYRGVLEGAMNSLAAAVPLLDDAIVSARALGDEHLLSTALFFRGLSSEGRPVEAKAFFEECMEVSRSVDDRTLLSYAKSELSEMAVLEGDYAGARALVLEAFEIARELGGITAAFARHNLASLEFVEGNMDAAESYATQLLEEWRGSELVWFVASLTSLLGEVSLARGDLQSSRLRLEEALEWSRKSQWPRLVAEALYYLGRLARSEGDVTRAESLVHEALDVTSKYGYVPGICDALEYLAGIAAQLESYEEAVRLFGGAARLRELIGYVRFPAMREGYEVDIAGVRETLAEEVFDRAWTEGLALTMGEAIDYARRGRGERKRPTVGWGSLTPTELEVVRLVSQGLSNPQIAERLFIARNTVKAHMSHIFSKLGTASRAELAAEATRRGL
jgi:predicted ATPase/DNA-binding CsgD family transcriptional regulator